MSAGALAEPVEPGGHLSLLPGPAADHDIAQGTALRETAAGARPAGTPRARFLMKQAPLATRFAASFESSPIPNPPPERADRTCPRRTRPDFPHAAAAPASFLPARCSFAQKALAAETAPQIQSPRAAPSHQAPRLSSTGFIWMA
ncbi:MAG: hypothetical protein JWN70_877, partial [Planctomycetaceae bacterium]|nr:hypothetical protein [Planctomycetaceae bacterium]